MVLAILESEAVIKGAENGLTLCIQVIIPSIFPFLFLAMLMCGYWKGVRIPLFKPICKAVGIPVDAQSILLLAVVGGYPIGAQAVAQARNDQQISDATARRLLGFCNNAGPSFIFGLMGTIFENRYVPVLLWVVHIGSALIVGYLLPDKHCSYCTADRHETVSIPMILKNAVQVTTVICGWVILFRILITLLNTWLLNLDPLLKTTIYGLLELSNGCVALSDIRSESIRFITAAALLSSGGLCVLMQTRSVTGDLGMGMYFPGKLMQTALSVLLSALICPFLYDRTAYPLPILICTVFCLVYVFALKRKKVVALCT